MNSANLYTIIDGQLVAVSNADSLEICSAVYTNAMPAARLPSDPNSLDNLTAHGASGLAVKIPTAGHAGNFISAFQVAQALGEGRPAEATSTAIGAGIGIATTAYVAPLAAEMCAAAPGGPWIGGACAVLVTAAVSYNATEGGNMVGNALTGGDYQGINYVDDMSGPMGVNIVRAQTGHTQAGNVQPTTILNGEPYVLVQVDGKYGWYHLTDNGQYGVQLARVVRGGALAQLTIEHLENLDFEDRLNKYTAEINSQIAKDEFIAHEIAYQNDSEAATHNLSNGLSPFGDTIGLAQTSANGDLVIWTRNPENGELIKIVRNGSGTSTLEQHYDPVTGDSLGFFIHRSDENGNTTTTCVSQSESFCDAFNQEQLNNQIDSLVASSTEETPRDPSSAFVNQISEHEVSLNRGGTLSDIILLQRANGNPISVTDILAANPQYTDVTKIPQDAPLNIPVRNGSTLTIYRSDGAIETIDQIEGLTTSTTTTPDGATHVVSIQLDGEGGAIYTARTTDSNTGEVLFDSAHYYDSFTGALTELDPDTLQPIAEAGDEPEQSAANEAAAEETSEAAEEPSEPSQAGTGSVQHTENHSSTGNGDESPVVDAGPSASAGSGGHGQSLEQLAAQVSQGQLNGLISLLRQQGIPDASIGGVQFYPEPDGNGYWIADANGSVIGTWESAPGADNQWGVFQSANEFDQATGELVTFTIGPQGQTLPLSLYAAGVALDITDSIGVVNSMANTIEGWGDMSDIQRLNALASIYNQIDTLGSNLNQLANQFHGLEGANALPGSDNLAGDFKGPAAVLGFLAALEGGDDVAITMSTLNLVQYGMANFATDQAMQQAATQLGNTIPVLNLILAVYNFDDDNLVASTGSLMSAMAAVNMIPVWGQVVGAILMVYSMMESADVITAEGTIEIDDFGNVVVHTTDDEGGAAYVEHWATVLGNAAVAAGMAAPQAGAPAAVMPSVGYYSDPEGFQYASGDGHMVLRWTDEAGEEHTRYYDASGMAWDGNSVEGEPDIVRDYLYLMQNAQNRYPPLAYEQVEGGVLQLEYGVATVLYATALGTFDGQTDHTHGGEEAANAAEVYVTAGANIVYSFGDNAADAFSTQEALTLNAGDIEGIPAPMGASAAGPHIPLGKDPIVFVPATASMAPGTTTVNQGMVTSLGSAQNLFSGAQGAALAVAIAASASASAAANNGHGQASNASAASGNGQAPNGADTDIWGLPATPIQQTSTGVQGDGLWINAEGELVADPDQQGAATAPVGPQVQHPDIQSEPPASSQGSSVNAAGAGAYGSGSGNGSNGSANALPEGFSSVAAPGTTPLLQAAPSQSLAYPTAVADTLDVVEDTRLRFSAQDLLANDSTSNPVPSGWSGDYFNGLRIVSVGNSEHGQVGIRDGELIFIPDPDFNGVASFSYTVVDMYGLSHTATATIKVQSVNDAPTAAGESATGNEDAELIFTAASLLRNDRDVDGDRLRISHVGEAAGGEVFLRPDGTIHFVPTPNYNGPAGYTYWVTDGQESASARVNLNILQVNDMPEVQGEYVESDEDVVLNFPFAVLLANDSDIDTDPQLNRGGVQTLSISAVGNAQHGTVQIVNGQVRFTPDQDYFGPASFDYLVDDGAGGQVSTTVVLNLASVNDAPVTQGETASTDEDIAVYFTQAQLLANDTDVDTPHAQLSVSQVGGAQNGSVELLPDGRIRFTPDADYFGPAAFDYLVDDGVGGQTLASVSLTVSPVNDAPRLQGEVVHIDEDTIVTMNVVDLLSNDLDVDNAHADLQLTGVSGASNGDVVLNGDGTITFTPTLNFYGDATFSYTVTDGVGGESTTTVTLDYASVNDLPVVNDEIVAGKRNITYTFSQGALLANDSDVEDGRNLEIVSVSSVANGTVTMLPNGNIQFAPAADYDNWSVGTYGIFTYVVQDSDGGQAEGVVGIDYSRVNLSPIAVDDHFHGYEDVDMEINVSQLLRNDRDPDPTDLSTLEVDRVANASHGRVWMSGNTVHFEPHRDFYGQARFDYRVNDGEGGTTWATAYIDIERENRAPVITNITVSSALDALLTTANVSYGEGFYYTVTGNRFVDDPHRTNGTISAYDPDGDAITFSVVSTSSNHGNAYVGQYVPSSAPAGLNHQQLLGRQSTAHTQDAADYRSGNRDMYGWDPNHPDGWNHNYFVPGLSGSASNRTANWQYISTDPTTWRGTDSFVIAVSDSRGAITYSDPIRVESVGWGSSGGCFPVAVDVDGDGIDLIAPEDSNMFADINGDGWQDRIGWVASSDALLAYDKNDDGAISDRDEVSFVGYAENARTDMEGLRAFDTDGDGQLTAADEEWARFGLLQDANGNGQQDEGEWTTLEELGIESIGLNPEGDASLNNGNAVLGTSTVTYADGHTTEAGDVVFAGNNMALPDWVQDELEAAGEVPVESFSPAYVSINQEQIASEDADTQSESGSEAEVEAQTEGGASTVAVATATSDVSASESPLGNEAQEITLLDNASIAQQANAFAQAAAANATSETPLGYVPMEDSSALVSVSTESDGQVPHNSEAPEPLGMAA